MRVVGQNHRAGFRHLQARNHFHASGLQLVDFAQQVRHRQHHAIADIAGHAGAHDAGRNQLQGSLLAVDHQGMTGVMAALKAHHTLRVIGQPVDDFAFSLVAPLGTDNDDIFCHVFV